LPGNRNFPKTGKRRRFPSPERAAAGKAWKQRRCLKKSKKQETGGGKTASFFSFRQPERRKSPLAKRSGLWYDDTEPKSLGKLNKFGCLFLEDSYKMWGTEEIPLTNSVLCCIINIIIGVWGGFASCWVPMRRQGSLERHDSEGKEVAAGAARRAATACSAAAEKGIGEARRKRDVSGWCAVGIPEGCAQKHVRPKASISCEMEKLLLQHNGGAIT
jgi:hypothetical protein